VIIAATISVTISRGASPFRQILNFRYLQESETRTVPADDGLRLDDDEDLSPAGPTTAQAGPEKSVQPVQNGPRTFALEHCDLLTEGQDLQGGVAPAAKENSDRRKECEDRVKHEPTLFNLTYRGLSGEGPRLRKLLISQLDQSWLRITVGTAESALGLVSTLLSESCRSSRHGRQIDRHSILAVCAFA